MERDVDVIADRERAVIGAIMQHVEPVSYTHLEVYKRQALITTERMSSARK